ncbi:hypothetical protein VTO42DRAFT_1518 [Malbranchea cinnamomea]
MPQTRSQPLSPSIRAILSAPSARTLNTFDIWNSASTGHQVGDGGGAAGLGGWNVLRGRQMTEQFRSRSHVVDADRMGMRGKRKRERDIRAYFGARKHGGQERERLKRKRDEEGTEKENNLGRGETKKNVITAEPERIRDDGGALWFDRREEDADQRTVTDPESVPENVDTERSPVIATNDDLFSFHAFPPDDEPPPSAQPPPREEGEDLLPSRQQPENTTKPKPIFADLTVYINGSTAPAVSDHKLRHLLATHGARISVSLTRRSVTHVILGRPNQGTNGGGCGGGLAAGKRQYEIQRVGGMGVKYVGVDWVLESIKAGRRLPEARFATLHMAANNQRSVLEHFG